MPLHILSAMITLMLSRPTKRQKKSTLLVEDDIEAADAVIHERVTTVTKSGKTKTKNILVPPIPVIEQPDSTYGGQGIQSDQVDCEGSYDNSYVKHEFPQCKSKVEHITSLLIYFLNK